MKTATDTAVKQKKLKLRPLPLRTSDMRPIDRFVLVTAALNAEIVPIEEPRFDVRRALKQLPPDEARKLKRKFRKLWRKCMKKRCGQGKSTKARERAISEKLEVGSRQPSRSAKNARKQMVFEELWRSEVAPALLSFDNPPESAKSAPAGEEA